MKLQLTVTVDYLERNTHPKDLEKLLLQVVPRAKEEGWLTTLHDARVKEITCVVAAVPEVADIPMPWCDRCQSYHSRPENREHWVALQCFASYKGEPSAFGLKTKPSKP